jgi:hypothetical protein
MQTLILPGTGRGTATRSGVVEGAHPMIQRQEDGPLHHASHGPPPRAGEEPMADNTQHAIMPC